MPKKSKKNKRSKTRISPKHRRDKALGADRKTVKSDKKH
jgi:hypothetical protein